MSDIKDLNNDELENVSGGLNQNINDNSNYGISFEKGKWVQFSPDTSYAYKMIELTDTHLIVDAWNRRYSRGIGTIIECTKNHTLPVIMLYSLVEIDKPDWVND